jgi:hypothetical protein
MFILGWWHKVEDWARLYTKYRPQRTIALRYSKRACRGMRALAFRGGLRALCYQRCGGMRCKWRKSKRFAQLRVASGRFACLLYAKVCRWRKAAKAAAYGSNKDITTIKSVTMI